MTQATNQQLNIGTIIRLEEEAERNQTVAESVSIALGRLVGTPLFIALQAAFVALWVAVNVGPLRFDPYPFFFLEGLLAFEAVILTAVVLIRQNRMGLRADRRNHLALQINLLAEQEATKIIQMLGRMSVQLGIEGAVTDGESRQLSGNTSIDGIVRELQEGLAADAKGAA